jgi:ribosomal protein S18 acetylase RimI-like enzyme
VADRAAELIGYAACSLEFSAWRAEDYIHLDCLSTAEAHQREGWGSALLAAVRRAAAERGADDPGLCSAVVTLTESDRISG